MRILIQAPARPPASQSNIGVSATTEAREFDGDYRGLIFFGGLHAGDRGSGIEAEWSADSGHLGGVPVVD